MIGWHSFALSMRRFFVPEPPLLPSGPLGLQIVETARLQIGLGEDRSNNRGRVLTRYREETGTGKDGAAWCATFCSWVLLMSCRELGLEMPLKPSSGAKQLYRRWVAAGAEVEVPRPGDLVLWERGARGDWRGHVGIYAGSDDPGIFQAIEGNRGRFPSRVRMFDHAFDEGSLLGFARLRMPPQLKDADVLQLAAPRSP